MKKKILLIEDDMPVLDTLKEILENRGYQVRCATDAAEALCELSTGIAPDWIVMDYGISGLNATSFIDKLRSSFPKSKIILASGYPEVEIRKEFIISSVDRFVPKPFNPFDLIRELN